MNAKFELSLENENEVQELRDLMNWKLSRMTSTTTSETDVENEIDASFGDSSITAANEEILKKFISQASDNQIVVLKWMKQHPGHVSAHILKQDLPFLAPTGTISGVFRPGRWQRLTGGSKDGFPFFQIAWNGDKGCGIYRGLTSEESAMLNI